MSLFICGCCGKDTTDTGRDTEKVRLGGYANMLCRVCRICLEEEVVNIAKRYLHKT